MKVTLLLICCSAIASTAYGRTFPRSDQAYLGLIQTRPGDDLPLIEEVFQELKKVLDYIAKGGLDAVHEFSKEVDRLLVDAYGTPRTLLDFANGRIIDYLDKAKHNLNVNVDQVAECVDPATVKLEQIAEQSRRNSYKCYDDVNTRFKTLPGNEPEHVSFQKAKVEEIQKIAADCEFENSKLEDRVKCILGHFVESTAVVQEIISDKKKLLTERTQELVSLTNDIRSCLLDVVRMSRSEMDKVMSEVYECLKEQKVVPSLRGRVET